MKRLAVVAIAAMALGTVACNRGERHARNDTTITNDVKRELADKQVPGSIDVATANGVVTLTGTVPDATAKDRAQSVANAITGVDRVVNNLRTAAADNPLRPGIGAQPGMQNPPGMPHQPGIPPAAPGSMNAPGAAAPGAAGAPPAPDMR
jgi:hypothetical protein